MSLNLDVDYKYCCLPTESRSSPNPTGDSVSYANGLMPNTISNTFILITVTSHNRVRYGASIDERYHVQT